MILAELYRLYGRLAADPEFNSTLPRMGMSLQKISFTVVLTPEGKLFDIQDAKLQKTLPARGADGHERTFLAPREMIVPGGAHPSGSSATPRLLWDNAAYMFGRYQAGAKRSEREREKAREVLFPAFRRRQREFMESANIQDPGMKAVVAFLESWDPANIPEEWREKIDAYGDNFGVFRLQGENRHVFESPEIMAACQRSAPDADAGAARGMCLITGKENVPIVATVKTKIKLPGTSVGGGALASFNAVAYESFGKKQTCNAPLSEEAAFKAYNALNVLIADKRFHFKLAETTVVFWTERKTESENLMPWILGESAELDPDAVDDAMLQKIEAFWQIVASAGDPDLSTLGDDARTPFYMLGIEPNAARIVVRFWQESTLGSFVRRLREHQRDIAIQKVFSSDPEHIPLWMLLAQTVRRAHAGSKPIPPPPLLAGELLRAVLEGRPYPKSLYQLTLNRVNVAHEKYSIGVKVSYAQASVIKGFLTRNTKEGGLAMSLNVENKDPAYLLGRLFATLEMTQNDASGGVNASIGDKFYSAASATPRIVFPTLLDLFRKRIKQLGGSNKGLAIFREKLVGEILDSIDSVKGFPAALSLEERGLFALGYYQQMRAFYTRKVPENRPGAEKENA